nr:response regulator [Actinomycetota bacterium]
MTVAREVVLVADDDPDAVRFIEANLRLEGFSVIPVGDGAEAVTQARALVPDLILLDVEMPTLDGLQVCELLRSDPRTNHIGVIMLTGHANSADVVVGLTAGADDYIIKPFDPIELVARVKSSLRRTRQMRAVNPLSQLPGNVQLQEEVSRRVAMGASFAALYIDLDNFKSFNDHYGFLRGDECIKALAGCVTATVQRLVGARGFVGHVGGDDFIAISSAEASEAVARAVIACWEDRSPMLYDPHDVERGYIDVVDRRDEPHRFPLSTVSIGIASNLVRPLRSHWEVAEIASEMKRYAKSEARSSYAVDRRSSEAQPV